MKAITVAALLASMAVTTLAQAQTYKWEDDYCSYKGDFNNKKYSAKQIKNSYFVLDGLTRTNLNSFFPPMSIEALDKLSMKDMDLLTEEYKQAKSDAERLDVVPEAKGYKQELLKSIDGEYKVNQLTILAYLNPSEALKQSPPMCHQYIKPLLQNESAVQSKWKQMVEKSAVSNSYAMSRYQEEKASNPAKYARIKLITFGFGNCVNEQVYHADSDKVFSNQQKINKTLFGKSFKQICDEP
ncbi:hypothetical protein [Psychrobacter urativorans]|uniref:Uncharacterized protein n=1 Tax=Psychrobacter urativorans TaxID=45610 RepID=A0A0M4TFN4_9GAMM|nr:hypothetical protein [Psychrobacter urativorans]ALF60116.1 hypothetical protein AOC03_08760 [Psychrobacter urativorans]